MTDRMEDLTAVLAAPQDDAPRLRFADELMARGDPRGEFIRAQIERARLAPDSDEAARLVRRERELLAKYEAEWVAAVTDGLIAWSFRRGFMEEATLDAETLLANGAALFAATPIQSIRVHEAGGVAEELAASPLLARVGQLHLGSDDGDGEPLSDAGLAALAGSPHLTALRALGFGMEQISGGALPALAGASWIGRLRSLDLSRNELGGDALAAFLAKAPLRRLEELGLDGTGAGAEAVAALAQGAWGELRRLNLGNNEIGGAGLAHLAAARLPALTALDLTCTGLAPGALAPLSASPWLPQLTELRIGANNKLEIGDIRAFFAAPNFPALRSLAVGGKFGEAGAKIVAGAAVLRGLKALDFSCSGLTGAAIEALAASPYLSGLEELELFSNKGTTVAAVAVAASPTFAKLRRLGLSNNEVGDAGAEALARSPHLSRLRSLSLRASGLTDVAARAIAGSAALANLEWIDLAFNKITGDGAGALAASAGLGNLDHLDISRNPLDREGATRLRERFGRAIKLG